MNCPIFRNSERACYCPQNNCKYNKNGDCHYEEGRKEAYQKMAKARIAAVREINSSEGGR